MALRLSGRFSVVVGRFPAISRKNCEFLVGLRFNSQVVHAHTSRESRWSFRAPSSAAQSLFRDRRPLSAARREHPPSRRSRPDCLPQTGSRQVPSARYRTVGILLRTPREFSLPHFRDGCEDELPIQFPQRDPSRCGTNRRRVAAKRCPRYPPARPFSHEYPSAIPKCPLRFPVPTAHRKDSRTPSKCKSAGRGLPPPFLSSAFRQASAIRPVSCSHSRAGNTPKWNRDIQSSSRQE